MVLVKGSSEHDDNSDAVSVFDFKGNPVDKSKTGVWLGAGLILGTELSERVCVVGISMNLVTYLVGEMHLSTTSSANIVTNFMGTLNLLALLGGFLADAKLGRYLTIAIADFSMKYPFRAIIQPSIIARMTRCTINRLSSDCFTRNFLCQQHIDSSMCYNQGVSLLTITTSVPSLRPPACSDYRRQHQHHECIAASRSQLALLYAALYTIALGGGAIKSNVSGFGSDQFDIRDLKEEKAMVFFFNRFYFCISLGSLFAVTVLVYIQDNVSRGWGYGISAATMVVAVVMLLVGTPLYRYRMPQGSPLTIIWRVGYLAWVKRKMAYPSDASKLNEYDTAKVAHTEKFRCLDKAAIISISNVDDVSDAKFDMKNVSTVTQVEEVKMILKLLPIWSTCILFWTVYSQMTTFSVEQATYMNRNIGSFVVPSGSLSFFLFITILLVTSLNEKFLVPFARKFTHNVQGMSSLQRVAIGLVFSMLAMVISAVVEKKRRQFFVNDGKKISVFWLVPQYFLVGIGEAFAYVGQLEFFIREAPERMKSMSTGLFLTTLALGFFLSSLLVSLVEKVTHHGWIRNNLNKGRLDYFYWMLAVLGVINFVVFLLFASRHEYKVQNYDWKNKGEESNGCKGKNNDAKQVVEEVQEFV